MESPQIPYPVRINRYLYLKGYCSRRRADTLVQAGKVKINGTPAQIGQQVQAADTVELAPDVRELPQTYRYFLYHKPRGIVSHNPQRSERSVEDVSGLGKKVFPVGRLDKASRGLMLLTDDGRIVHTLLAPEYAHEREYRVAVDKRITDSALGRMRKGVRIEGYVTKPAHVTRVGEKSFRITLTEGKKHQIRRMCSALGYTVTDLLRTRIAHLTLGSLKEGAHRPLTHSERSSLLRSLDIPRT